MGAVRLPRDRPENGAVRTRPVVYTHL